MNSRPLAMNTAGDERRLLQNMVIILTISLNYSSLIDVLKSAYYNIVMDENNVVTLIEIETAAPKRRITRSAGAVYLALIVLMIGCISIGNLLYTNWQIPRFITQPILYLIIAICGYFIYRRHYLSYRYTLTDEMFAIEQIGGNSERTIAAISLRDIRRICDRDGAKDIRKNILHASIPPQKDTTWITTLVDGKEMTYTISASEEFVKELTDQWRRLQTPQDM